MGVVFVGAGPGNSELLTVRGKKEIEMADVIIYAGSLINKDVLKYAKGEAMLINSHGKSKDEIFSIIERFVKEGKKVVRLHSGDPSFYSAIQEQIEFLNLKNIKFEVVSGVSSLSAASAALKRELTSPGISQTLIITKPYGKTGKPTGESIKELSKNNATMIIFLGVHLLEEIVSELLNGYPPDTPVAVVHKASWKEEKILRGTLEDITEKVKEARIKSQSLIIVGNVLEKSGFSKVYSGEEENGLEKKNKKISIFFISQKSIEIAKKVKEVLYEKDFNTELICSEKISCKCDKKVKSVFSAIRDGFRERTNIIAILPLGITMRAIEPRNKTEDPWVIGIDENGKWIIPVLNGHRGANEFSKLIAEELSAQVIITTHEDEQERLHRDRPS